MAASKNGASEVGDNPPIGIIQKLWEIGNVLLSTSQEEVDSQKRKKIYNKLSRQLEKEAEAIQILAGKLDNEVSEKVRKKCMQIDEKFLGASNLFLDAIDIFQQFIETESPELIDDGLKCMMDGAAQLEEGNELAKALTGPASYGEDY